LSSGHFPVSFCSVLDPGANDDHTSGDFALLRALLHPSP
jgi:hypothetical protein